MTTELPASARRVPVNTAEYINQEIRRQTLDNLACYANKRPAEISRRLEELDREWDIERALETNAGALALFGFGMGVMSSKKWLLLPAMVAGFLLQHGLQGWCPPVPIFRRLGFRTRHEIDLEKFALKILRGDFKDLAAEQSQDKDKILDAVES